MMILLIVVLVLVIGAVVAVVVGRVGADSMSAPTATSAFDLPEGKLGSAGVDAVRLDQSLRGYNMAQVDAVLDRLFDEIHDLEARVERREHDEPRDERVPASRFGTGRAEQERAERAADVVQFRRRRGEGDDADA